MREHGSFTPEEVAQAHDRHLWNVGRNGTLILGSVPASDAELEVRRFILLMPLFSQKSLMPEYVKHVRAETNGTSPNRSKRISILHNVINHKVAEYLEKDHSLTPEALDSYLQVTMKNIILVTQSLRRQDLRPFAENPDPFTLDITDGKKIKVDIEGEVREMEAKAACPAVGLVRRLYADFEQIINTNLDQPSEN